MKRFTAISMAFFLMLGTLTACGLTEESEENNSFAATENAEDTPEAVPSAEAAGAENEDTVDPADWTEYDSLIKEIQTATDYVKREAFMHRAEDMLMETGAILPLYYCNDIYMHKSDITNIYMNQYGFKYFMFAQAPEKTLKLQLGSEPDALDPAFGGSADSACMIVNSFAGLYTYDADGNVQPDLASGYTVSEDGLTYTIDLLPELVWSDGSELNAADFVYSWNRAANPRRGAKDSYMFDVIAVNEDGTLQVTASEDGRTLTVTLSVPCAYFIDLLAFPAFYPVKQSEVEAAVGWENDPGAWCREAGYVTNGAYTVSSWTHGDSIVMTKNPNYHRADEVDIETIEVMLSADDEKVFAAYNAGSLDFIDTVPVDEIQDLLDNPEFHITDCLGTYYVSFHVNSDLFAGKTPAQANAMRRAFALLIDRGYIAENIGQTGQIPANTIIPPGMSDGHGGDFRQNDGAYTYPDAENVGYFNPYYSQENMSEARSLLESAGYLFDEYGVLSPETPISFEYLTDEGTAHAAVAEALQQDFAMIGIDMSIRMVDRSVFLEERREGNYDVARDGWLADFNDPVNMLEIWTAGSGYNHCGFEK